MAAPSRPRPEPMQTNDLPIIVMGTVVWALAFVVLLVRSDYLADELLARWVWACVAGLFLGGIGIRHLRRKARTERDEKGTKRAAPRRD